MQNPIGEADLEWILHRNCEGTEQLRINKEAGTTEMTEDNRKSGKNNSGFSLVELIIVIAIIAALIGTVILSVSMVFSANAKACSNDLQRAVADCKVTTMGKAQAWLIVYRGENGSIYSQLHIMEQKEGGEAGELQEIKEEPQKIGGNRVSVTYKDASGNEGLELPTGADAGIRIEFDRSSGSFKEAPQQMRIQGGSRDYKLDFIRLTGKIAVNQPTS